MTYEEACRRLNACKYLYLDNYGKSERALDLRIEVVEAQSQGDTGPISTGSELLDDILGPGEAIEPDDGCAHFTITFTNYIAISIINESYDDGELSAQRADPHLRTYDKSHFRSYISSVTFASDDYPGPFKHFELSCLDHTLNVACGSDPNIVISTIGEVSKLNAALAEHDEGQRRAIPPVPQPLKIL